MSIPKNFEENLDNTLRDTLALLEQSFLTNENEDDDHHCAENLDKRLIQPSQHQFEPKYENDMQTKVFLQGHKNAQQGQYVPHTPDIMSSAGNLALLSAFVPLSAVAESLAALLDAPSPTEGDPVLGAKLLIRLAEHLQQRFYRLVRFPQLIVENLVMLGLVEDATSLFLELPNLRDDNMLCEYAQHTVVFPPCMHPEGIVRASIRRSNFTFSSNNDEQRVWVSDAANEFRLLPEYNGKWDATFTGEASADNEIRKTHFFATSPDSALCIGLLDLCSDRQKAGHVCLDICDSLVYYMNNTISTNLGLIQQVAQELLRYASSCFVGEEYETRLCDTFTDGVAILATLKARGMVCVPSLLDLSDPYKSSELCKILVNAGMPDMALEFAPKCFVPVSDIWAAWGFKCLNDGDYGSARDKFAEYFALSEPSESQLIVLSKLVQILEQAGCHSEVVRYLRTYGTPRLLVEWWVAHDQVTEACLFLVEHSLPSDFLINQIVEPCCRMGRLSILLDALRQAGSYYLTAVCKHFNTKSEYYVLLEFQTMMGDYLRAGLTCIKIFLVQSPFDFQTQQKYLLEAKAHLTHTLATVPSSEDTALLGLDSIEKYIQKVLLQLEILDCFKERVDALPPSMEHYSVFGNQKQRTALAYLVISLDLNLGIKMVTRFNLPRVPILRSAAQLLAASGSSSGVDALLNQASMLELPNAESDEVVLSAIKAFASSGHTKPAELLIARLMHDRSRVLAFLACGRIATATLLAERTSQPKEIMQLLLDSSSRSGQEAPPHNK